MSAAPVPRPSPGLATRAVLGTVRLYQLLRAGRPSPCRYVPSCSDYAHQAVEVHGLRRGGLLALRRLARCHPWARYGLDPVPE